MTQHADLLAAWREEQGPSALERARMWEGIAAKAELGDPLADDVEVAPPVSAARSIVRPRFVVGAIALAAAAVLALAIAPRGRELPRTVEPALQQSIRAVLPSVQRPVHEVATPPRVEPIVEPAIVEPAIVEPVTPAGEPARAKAKRVAPASIDPAEVELLERAQRRLGRDPLEALALFEQHARDYPRSALAAERELGRADAKCRSGDVDGARALVDRFARTRRSSPLLARMRSICAEP
jgi:hypothetical protein